MTTKQNGTLLFLLSRADRRFRFLEVQVLIYAVLLCFFDLPTWTVLVILCARGIGDTFQPPAIQSIIPQIVPSE